MSIFDKFLTLGKKVDKQVNVLANGTELGDQKDVEDPTAKFASSRFVKTTYGYQLKRNVTFQRPEYDLDTIANAIEMDGLLQRAVAIFEEQILKNGYEFVSKEDEVQTHITTRIREIESLTGITFFETLSKIARQLVSYGNAYVIKVRSPSQSQFGKPYRLYGRSVNPIVGLFVADATTVEIGLNDRGQITNYRQRVRGEEIIWDERDVMHFTYHRTPGTLTGMSSIIPVLDDIRALRKLEEEIEILGFQYSIPLYLYKVGNKDQPAAPGEIESVTSMVNNMPAYGMLVVPGHHSIEVPTNNNTPVDILSFCNHFKKRMYSGLGVSPVAMGEAETSNRNTTESQDLTMQTITISYQRIIKHRVEIDFVREILLDGGFDYMNNVMEFNFSEIDIENQIKKETHTMSKFQNNIITHEEARHEMNYDQKYDEQGLFMNKVSIPTAKAQADAKLKAQANATDNKNRPANQHGKQASRPKIVKNFVEDVVKYNTTLVVDIMDDMTTINKNRYQSKLISMLTKSVSEQINYDFKQYCDYYNIVGINYNYEYISDYLIDLNNIFTDKINRLSKSNDDNKTKYLIESINDLIAEQFDKAESLTRIMIYKSLGYKTILLDTSDCNIHAHTIMHLDSMTYNKIPPMKHGCKCKIDEKGTDEFKKSTSEDSSQD